MEDHNVISPKESNSFYILKAFAIFFAMSAHVVPVHLTNNLFLNVFTGIWQVLCRVGVPLFLILSGFFYTRQKGDGIKFWKKKFISILLPWIISGVATATFIFFTQKIGGSYILYTLKFVIGYESFFYFLTILVVMFIVFKFIPKNTIVLILCVLTSVVSIVFESFNLNLLSNLMANKYLNPFNWVGFFALGILARSFRLDRKLLSSKKPLFVLIPCSALGFVLYFLFRKATYFHAFALFYELPTCLLLLYFSFFLAETKASKPLVAVGKWSYFMYLYHLLIVQKVCYFLPTIITPFYPFVALIVMCVLSFILSLISKKLRFVGTIFGIR